MSEAVELWEKPQAEAIFMLAGWRQWADAGGVSSALPRYLVQQTSAKQIGALRPDGFYLFQIPGTHDLVRPTVKFAEGYPESLQTRRNEFHYAEVNGKGLVVFLGDEPHLDIERYVTALLDAAQRLERFTHHRFWRRLRRAALREGAYDLGGVQPQGAQR